MHLRNNAIEAYFKYLKPMATTWAGKRVYWATKAVDQGITHARLQLVRKGVIDIDSSVSVVHVSLLSNCNLRCAGCLYGREFMPKEKLTLSDIHALLDGMHELHIPKVHFYGGEPLLHVDLYDMVEYATKLGIFTTLGTNGILLKPQNADRLHAAGLRHIGIGVYGTDAEFDDYVGKPGSFAALDANLSYLRSQYPDIDVTFSWLLKKPTCRIDSLHQMMAFSIKHQVPFDIALIHYDFPYFTEGKDGELQFHGEDLPLIEGFVREAIALKRQHPQLITNSLEGLASIPDWLIQKEAMRPACHRYSRLWIGPNGVVRVCQKNSDLGNLKAEPLTGMLNTKAHKEAAQVCYQVACSNCHVGYDERIQLDPERRKQYAQRLRELEV